MTGKTGTYDEAEHEAAIVQDCIDVVKGYWTLDASARKPAFWQDAMFYLRYQNGRNVALAPEEHERGMKVLQNYRALYLFEKLSFEKMVGLMQVSATKGNFFELVEEALGEDIREVFVEQYEPKVIGLGDLQKLVVKDEDANKSEGGEVDVAKAEKKPKLARVELEKLYRYPEWIEYTAEADAQVRKWILEDKLSDKAIDYYLGTSEEAKDYTELYPVVKHILQTTENYHLFFVAGDVLNLIWITSPEDEEIEGWLQREIYEIFWPRIGGMWPLRNAGQVKFLDDDRGEIFADALGWIFSLRNKTLQELNPELWKFLQEAKAEDYDDKDDGLAQKIAKKVFSIKHEHDSFDELLEQAEKGRPEFEELLKHPQNVAVAKQCVTSLLSNLEPELLPKKQEKLQQILSDNHYNDPEVRQIVLKTTTRLISRLPKEGQLAVFEAACEGAQTSQEIAQVEELAEVMNELNPSLIKRVKAALKNVRQEIAELEAETEALREGLLRLMKGEEVK